MDRHGNGTVSRYGGNGNHTHGDYETIKKYENGERALSITNLFKIIDYFKVDANTILNVAESKKETSIDSRLELMDCSKKAYFQKIFNEMLDNAEMLVS